MQIVRLINKKKTVFYGLKFNNSIKTDARAYSSGDSYRLIYFIRRINHTWLRLLLY